MSALNNGSNVRLPHSLSHSNALSATASPIMSPRRTANQLLIVHLPFGQHSKVEVRPNEKVCDALKKCLTNRSIKPGMCHIGVHEDPRGERIDPQDDMERVFMLLEKKELWVHSEYLHTVSSIRHEIIKKSFIPQGTCDVCRQPIWLTGFWCKLCSFSFHQRCSSKIPMYCDLIQQVQQNDELIAKLRQVCRDVGGPNSAMAEDLLLTMNPSPAERDLTRKPAVRQRPTPAPVPPPIEAGGPYPRDRSSSAPNINSIADAARAEAAHDRIMESLQAGSMPHITLSTKPKKLPSRIQENVSAEGVKGLPAWRPLNPRKGLAHSKDHLNPSTVHSASNSPSSTCSSPPAHSLHPPSSINFMSLTPPQSAPPQKITAVFFRGRSKSPGDRLDSISPRKRASSQSKNEDWEVDDRLVNYHCKVGSGSFGTVFRADYFGTVAVKKLNVGEPTLTQLQAFKNEVAVLKKNRHPNVLMFMGWMRVPSLAIITQWCEGSSLFKHLHVVEPRVEFSLSTIVDLLKQISLGMNYLHSKNIIHRDLKTNNIFLTEDSTIKIGDFGLATVKSRWSGSQQSQQPTGSILWMAPEVIRQKDANPYSTLSDVYAFGICIFELLSGCLPYSHINHRDQILFGVGMKMLRPDVTLVRSDCPKSLILLYEKCIEMERDNRPEFSQVLAMLQEVSLPKLTRSASAPVLSGSATVDIESYYLSSMFHHHTPKIHSTGTPTN